MRFKEYLFEQNLATYPIITPVEEQEAFDWVKLHAPSYIQNLKKGKTNVIWRGMPMDFYFATGDGSAFKRKAANTSNFTNLLVSNFDSWKDYPPRNQSYICSTSKATAHSFGDPMMVIPADNAQIGICPDFDFWRCFKILSNKFGLDGIDELNDFLSEISAEDLNDTSIVELRSQLSQIDRDYLEEAIHTGVSIRFETAAQSMFEYLSERPHHTLLDALEHFLDPDLNGFDFTNAASLGNLENNFEIWIHGKVLIIDVANAGDWIYEI